MEQKNTALNAGVQAATGLEFQKHCAIYLFLDDIKHFETNNFFLCIEHHDDILFCQLNENDEISEINAYQAKKSTNKWNIAKEEFNIILKMLKTSGALLADSAKKSNNCQLRNYFTTNNTIDISSKNENVKIDETNSKVMFDTLPDNIRSKIQSGVLQIDKEAPISHLQLLGFIYLDLGRTAKAQINQLVGLFGDVYGSTIADHRAAIVALIALFRKVELVFNQGGNAKLLDKSKIIEKKEIFDVLEIITTKQKAYNLWRERGQILASKLNVSVAERTKFEVEVSNCFDLFKDINQQEHRIILKFVEDNKSVLSDFTTDEECIDKLYSDFNSQHRTQLLDQQVKAAIFSAYIEIRG